MEILVIGGTSGIGKAIVERLNNEGHQVHVAARNMPDDKVNSVDYIQMDALTDELNLDSDKLDGLVYCPGSINLKPFNRLKETDFTNDFNINVVGAVRVLQQAHGYLKKSDHPSVVLFSTVAVSQGMPYHASTAASKAAVEGLTRSLAAEWAPAIRVNAIAPSITDTPMASRILSSEDRRENSAKRHPLQRVGTPSDVATMAAFLLSSDSSWMTGQVVGVDGGMSTVRGL